METRFPIVFVSEKPSVREAKLGLGLRRRGIPVLLIYREANIDPSLYFEHAIQVADTDQAIHLGKQLSAKVFHVFSLFADMTAMCFVMAKFAPTVFDAKDVFETLVGFPQTANLYKAQRECIEGADALCSRDLQTLLYCRVNGYKRPRRGIFFPEFCLNQDVAKTLRDDDEVHAVVIGNITVEKRFPQFADSGLIEIARSLAESRIHLHVYPKWWGGTMVRDDNDFADYIDLDASTEYFHLHQPVAMENICDEISQYDFALMANQGNLFNMPENTHRHGLESYGVAGRLYDYIDAELEVVVTPCNRLQHWMLERAGAAVPLTRESLGGLRSELLTRRNNGSLARARKAKDYLNIDRHIGRLIDFYDTLGNR